MIDFDLKNLGVQKLEGNIAAYIAAVKSRKQGFYEIIDDKKTAKEILKFAKTARKKYKHFVLLGIGGSSLGPICLEQSFGHLFKEKKLLVLDNIDPVLLAETKK